MNKDLEAFLKDPAKWLQQQEDSIRQRRKDAEDYYYRQQRILEDTYIERLAELDKEEDGVTKKVARWSAQYGVTVEIPDEL